MSMSLKKFSTWIEPIKLAEGTPLHTEQEKLSETFTRDCVLNGTKTATPMP